MKQEGISDERERKRGEETEQKKLEMDKKKDILVFLFAKMEPLKLLHSSRSSAELQRILTCCQHENISNYEE